jgi:ABC-2 type transport system permease protein
VLSGIAVVGTQPLIDLTGHLMPGLTAFVAVVEGWATVLPPVLAVTGIGLLASVVSRNSWIGVVVPVVFLMLCQLVGLLSAIDPIRAFLPSTGFDAWHGLVRSGIYLGPLWQSLGVSAVWAVVTVSVAAIVLRRRDVVDG